MEEYKGLYYEIEQDDSAESPDSWGCEEFFLVYDHRQFCVKRKGFNPENIYEYLCWQEEQPNAIDYELYEEYEDSFSDWNSNCPGAYNDYYIFPVYAYIHSGVSLSLGRGSDRFDTSMRGYILVDRICPTKEDAEKIAQEIINDWNNYLSGEVYQYKIYEKITCPCCANTQYNLLDSCAGFYSLDECKKEIFNTIDNY